jgi:hypothetical protein
MAGMRWLKWGLFFSVVLFVALYFLIYTKIDTSQTIPTLKLGNMDVSFLAGFFSTLKNVIITSLIVGFLLGLLSGGSRRNRQY